MVFFHWGAKFLTFQQSHNTSIALSVPKGGGQTPLPISMGGHGRICLPWIRHCQRAWYLSLCNVKYLLYNYCSVMVILYGPIFCCGMQNIDYATFPRCKT